MGLTAKTSIKFSAAGLPGRCCGSGKRPRERCVAESRRLLGVLDKRLEGRAWIMGDAYTIADITTFPWVRNLLGFYGAGELVGIDQFTQVTRALAAFVVRPAVDKALNLPKRA